jgi:hypothetical protein
VKSALSVARNFSDNPVFLRQMTRQARLDRPVQISKGRRDGGKALRDALGLALEPIEVAEPSDCDRALAEGPAASIGGLLAACVPCSTSARGRRQWRRRRSKQRAAQPTYRGTYRIR